LGYKEKGLNLLLDLVRNQNLADSKRFDCSQAIGRLGNKEIAVPIIRDLYLKQKDKTTNIARVIYSSLWQLTTE